ncbi:LaeA-like protein, partial [Bisporella sp. PMI_857]
ENDRLYFGFRQPISKFVIGKYLFPCDEGEKDRMDIYHKLFSEARRGFLYSAPLYDVGRPPRIMDLGTGTGIWAIEMAEYVLSRMPHAEILGIDLVEIQPAELKPKNLRFEHRDFEAPWSGLGLNSWDLIHLRALAGCIEDLAAMYRTIYNHLQPNTGFIEHVEIDLQPRWEKNGEVPINSMLSYWYRTVEDATFRANRPIKYNPEMGRILEETGFVDIKHEVIMIPLNHWPNDAFHKTIGRWYNLGLTQGLQALTLAPLYRMSGFDKARVDGVVDEARKEACTRRFHTYNEMHIWTARRPS